MSEDNKKWLEAMEIVCMGCAYKEGYDYDFKKKKYIESKKEWIAPCETCMVRATTEMIEE